MTLRLTDFMCVCTEDAKAQAEACMKRVLTELKTDPDRLLTDVVYGLEWGLDNECTGAIKGIGCDQWCGVSVGVSRAKGREYVDHATIWVQCDLVEHGVARAWELASDAANLELVE